VKWRALVVLSLAQFLMVLDQAVMNVSISQLVEDFDTSVTVIQGVITFYALTMAALMITGGKLGDRYGRKKTFAVGLVIYAAGSALTAVSQTVPMLLLGWSILEGVGAALVLPALVALIAGSYQGPDRAVAYGVIGGVAGAGIAVGPILGGWVTTAFTWRWVFVGEVILALAIVSLVSWIADTPPPARRPSIDWVGSVLSGLGLGVFVYGILQASQWGWLRDSNSPFTVLGLALTPFVIGAGILILFAFVRWSERRERRGLDPLFHMKLFENAPLKVGLQMFLGQNIILMGVFFSLPLYLQVVLGLDALETGLRMLPVSVTMFIFSFAGARLSEYWSPRRIVRTGLWVLLISVVLLMGTIEPALDGFVFGLSMALLGVGMGLMASQLGNLVQSAVGPKERSEAGGLQYTAQQLGSSIGTALIGAIVISSLTSVFLNQVTGDERVSDELKSSLTVELHGSVEFVTSGELQSALDDSSLPSEEAGAIVESYKEGQLIAIKIGLLVGAAVVVAALLVARRIPDESFEEIASNATESGADPPNREQGAAESS
jgi:EmrB/QacA subfamily drug resistance transporter